MLYIYVYHWTHFHEAPSGFVAGLKLSFTRAFYMNWGWLAIFNFSDRTIIEQAAL